MRRDKNAAEDILQDVLMGMYGKWRRLRTSPEAYARAALANAAANRWRSRKPEAPMEHAETPLAKGHEQQVTEADTARALGCGVGTVTSQTSRGLARLRELMGEQVLTWS